MALTFGFTCAPVRLRRRGRSPCGYDVVAVPRAESVPLPLRFDSPWFPVPADESLPAEPPLAVSPPLVLELLLFDDSDEFELSVEALESLVEPLELEDEELVEDDGEFVAPCCPEELF